MRDSASSAFPVPATSVDALLAADARAARPSSSGTRDPDLHGVDAVIVPGGFSYGDYLRVGAIARFAPVMGVGARPSPRDGGPVLGICNGFQVLCEAGLLPGALLPNTSLRFVCRQVEVEVVNPDTAFTRACARGRAAVDPGQAHHRPLLLAREPLERAPGRAPLRARPEPQRLAATTSRGSATPRATCSG